MTFYRLFVGAVFSLFVHACSGAPGTSTGNTPDAAIADAGTPICAQLGADCDCPDAGTRCTSSTFGDDPYLWCRHETCISYCNAPTQPERDAKCPSGFRCTDYAFESEPSEFQCRRP